MRLYDAYLSLRLRLSDAALPETVAVVVTERDLLTRGAYDTLASFLDWAFDYGAASVIVYVSVLDEEVVPALRDQLTEIDTPRPIAVRGPDEHERVEAPVQVSIGLGGKHEFAAAVRSIAQEVESGDIDPSAITEEDVEQRLVFPTDPDLVIKTGAERLSDFMIWQSVYSELYFTDVNWQNLRRRDYLRALREYQERQRRFGR